MKKYFFTVLVLLITANLAFTQTSNVSIVNNPVRKNAIYLDLGGWALWYSLNFEHRISLADNHRLGLGGGLLLIPAADTSLLAGLSVNFLLGKTHNLEIGFTPSVFFEDGEKEFVFSPLIGYRYESAKGLLFRIGLSPVSTMLPGIWGEPERGLIPWGYLSLGYAF